MKVRANVVLAAAVGVIVVLVAISAVVASTRDPVELDPTTPQGAVQAYLLAVADSDPAAAAAYLAADSSCDIDNLAEAYLPPSFQAELVSAATDEDTAVVTVTITEGAGVDLFEPSGYSHTERFSLTREADGWRLTGSPWPMYECGGWLR